MPPTQHSRQVMLPPAHTSWMELCNLDRPRMPFLARAKMPCITFVEYSLILSQPKFDYFFLSNSCELYTLIMVCIYLNIICATQKFTCLFLFAFSSVLCRFSAQYMLMFNLKKISDFWFKNIELCDLPKGGIHVWFRPVP